MVKTETLHIVGTAPEISTLGVSPSVATKNSGEGAAIASISFNYYDQDSDIETIIINKSSVQTRIQASKNKNPFGQIRFEIPFSTVDAGKIDFIIYVLDSAGNKSNVLAGSFEVTN